MVVDYVYKLYSDHETVETEIKLNKRLQRVRGAGSRIEMLFNKWTVEGMQKPARLGSTA